MYPEVVALSRNSRGELSTIITKIEVTMENSRQAKEEAHDATEDFQSEVLDLSTKQTPSSLGPSSTLSRSLSLSSPPLQSKRRRMDPDSDCASSSRESSDFCTNPRTHKTFTDATLDCDVFTPGGVGGAESRSRHLGSISPSSTDDEARMGTVDSSSVLRAPDYPSLLPSMPPLHSISPAAHPIADRLRDIPAFLVGHPLNMAVAAAVGGVNSPLNAFNANCSMGSTLLLDCSASPLRPADCTTARLTPYASSYFPPSSRRRQKAAAPRSGGRWEAAGSPRPPAASLVDPKAVEDAVIGDGAAGRTTAGSGGDRSQFEERDSAYLERRRKNNEAAKRSRDARRHKEEEIAYRAAKLEQENISLRAELLLLRRESAELHHLLYGRMDPQR